MELGGPRPNPPHPGLPTSLSLLSKALRLVSHSVEINGTLLKCMVDPGAEVSILLFGTEGETQSIVQTRQDLLDGGGIPSVGFTYSLQLDSNTKPLVPPPRRVPPLLLDKIPVAVQRKKDTGILREVEGPVEWSSPTVIISKKKGNIRLCADFRSLNKYGKREQFH
ncbi:unnamed protein product [Caretta caretta]